MTQDPAVNRLQVPAGDEPTLVDPLPVGLEAIVRFLVPPRLVEGEQQLAEEPFSRFLAADERFQLTDDFGVPSEREVGFEPVLERLEASLDELPDLCGHARLERQLGERLPRQRASACRKVAARSASGSPFARWTSRSKRARSSCSGATCKR